MRQSRAMERLAIAIAGCGPAGLAAALLLDAQGHRVTIFDQFDQPGPVGSGLMIQPSGLAVLDRMGLAGEVLRRGARIDALVGIEALGEASGRRVLDASYARLGIADACGIGIHRASLFGVLMDLTGVRSSAFMLMYGVVWVSLIWMYWTEVRRANPMGDASKNLSLQN